jgi:hypothetical protein
MEVIVKRLKSKLFTIQNLLWLALVLALVGSLRHVAWGFSTLEQGDWAAGYVQAIAVDLGLLAIAIGIQRARAQGRRGVTRWLWVGAGLFAAISVYANLLHGLAFESAIRLQRDWGQFGVVMIALRPFLLSGVLPLMVIYLSEIVAANYNYQQESAESAGVRVALDVPQPILAGLFLDNWKQQHGREPTVPEFVVYFEQQTGERVEDDQADQYILEWRSEHSVVGARPVKAILPVPGYRNGNGVK